MKHITDPLLRLLEPYQYAAVIDGQWGDICKGKLVDLLASVYGHAIVRRTGSNNAGHTVQRGSTRIALSIIPCGILYDADGKLNIIDEFVGFNPMQALREIAMLHSKGFSCNNLVISHNAHLLMPQHIVMDMVRESSPGVYKVGTTGRGVGPCFTDSPARTRLRVNDMLVPDVLRAKLKENLRDKVKVLSFADPEIVRKVMRMDRLENGIFLRDNYEARTDGYGPFDFDAIMERYIEYGKLLKGFIRNTRLLLEQLIRDGKQIIFEGAQGTLLSVHYGTYPNVTSTDPSRHGLLYGLHLDPAKLLPLLLFKFPYMTRVGEGPFPTELGGEDSARWCGTKTRDDELELYPNPDINSSDPREQGAAIRRKGVEFGTVTGRPRRTGWFDLELARYAARVHSGDKRCVAVTAKSDVLDECEVIKIGTEHIYNGPDYPLGDTIIRKGSRLQQAIVDDDFVFRHCTPVYREFEGWNTKTSGVTTFEDTPRQFRELIGYIEREANLDVRICSVGPDSNQTIIRG